MKGHPDFEDLGEVAVSSHLMIRRDAELLQFVAFDKRAWHAGTSSFQGRSACNDYSIGIELEGSDDSEFRDEQYHCLAQVCRVLLGEYTGLSREHIVGHSDIAPGRKTDPGPGFNWPYLMELIGGN